MNRILLSLGVIAFVGAAAAGATGAFFNDTETSTGNTFAAGDIDLQIDSVAHYNGMVCTLVGNTYHWIPESDVTLDQNMQPVADVDMNEQTEWDVFNTANPTQYPEAGTACQGTWPVGNLDENTLGMDEFFNFSDIKPGDNGENTVSVHVGSNDAWMCVSIANIADADNTCTEPEDSEVGELCTVSVPENTVNGELDSNLNFFAWRDDGDNVFESGEVALGGPVAANTLLAQSWALAESGDTPIPGDSTQYIGLAWCAGTMSVVGNTISCNGSGMSNLAQTDSWGADLTFYVEQSRNNPNFLCNQD